MRIFQRQQERECDQRPDSFDLFQQRHLRIALLRESLDALVVLGDLFAQRFQCRQQRPQCRLQLRAQAFGFFRIHIAHIAAAQAFSVALGQAACAVHQPGARSHQRCSRSNHGEIRLGCGAAMLHWTQQLRVDPCQPRQRLRILEVVAGSAGIFLLVGLWTPIAGAVVAVTELWIAVSGTDHLRGTIMFATTGVVLAVLGPGARSVDALLFGRKRLDI